jgi:uncharacterized protein
MSKVPSSLDYFPLSVASGRAFCNREAETEKLKQYIEHQRPVLLVSPRRYGKTSLALQAIQQTKVPFAHIDFFSVVEVQDIEKVILRGIGELISRIESMPKRALALASEIFGNTQIRVAYGKLELSLDFNRRKEKPAYNILDILERLERLAAKTKQNIVLFLDEFQSVSEVTSDHAIESVLRQVAQLTQSIAFIFSGSNRHLLNKLFDDRNRPLYKLCERIMLERIMEQSYAKHLQKVAHKTWQVELPQRVLDYLFQCTECHPYYMNLLCARLWNYQQLPTVEIIEQLWRQYRKEERSSVAAELELLSKNQRKLLTVLARTGGTNAPLGQEFIHQANMAKATIDQALTFLEKKDYVIKDKQGYSQVLDPLIKSVLSEN